jgi:hypothetical protein
MSQPSVESFSAKFKKTLTRLSSIGRGCDFCQNSCFIKFSGRIPAIIQWRSELAALPTAAQDARLAAIFWPDLASTIGDSVGDRCDTTSESDSEPSRESDTEPLREAGSEREVVSSIAARIDTSASESDAASELDVCDAGAQQACFVPGQQVSQQLARSKRPEYNLRRKRRRICSIEILDAPVCFQAAKLFAGVGASRLYRIKSRRADGRSDGNRRAARGLGSNATKTPSVLRFLWRLYHSVGEGMPDKFVFDRKTLIF